MDMYKRYKSALGYELGDDGIDSYGVDHNGFSTRDELAYQFARDKREGKLLDYYQSQGINDNYPQYGSDFWGDDAADNYGFGSSEIEGRIGQVTDRLDNGRMDNQQNISSDGSPAWDNVKNFTQNDVNAIAPYIPTYYVGYGIGTAQNTFNKLKDLYGAYKQNGATYAAQQYGEPSVKRAIKAAEWLTPLPISDVNKHQYVSCVGSTGGPLAMTETIVGGVKKEIDDYKKKVKDSQLFEQYGGRKGILKDNIGDFVNDVKGAWKGIFSNNPEECEELLPEQYRKKKRYW